MSRKHLSWAVALAVVTFLLIAVPSFGASKRPSPEAAVNNLSYPAIAVDGFGITPVATQSFTVPYTGDYPGLTAEEIAYLDDNGPWYAQKTAGNVWQAEYASQTAEDVTYIDWSDNMESVSPKIRSPFRIEMVLFKALPAPMTAYTMNVLEYPSSTNELQGTNATTYDSDYATVVSSKPGLKVQYLGTVAPAPDALTWDAADVRWEWADGAYPSLTTVSFAPELNVGGKYVFGASSGGWKPASLGYYRITFYVPSGSGLNLAPSAIANESTGFTAPTEGVAQAVLDSTDNLTYIDVNVKASGGGGRP